MYHTNADTTKNKKLKNLSDIFTVKITEMLPYWDAVHVDLARLSQPLLPHLVSLLKELLQWFKRKTNSMTVQNKNNGNIYNRKSDKKENENGNKISNQNSIETNLYSNYIADNNIRKEVHLFGEEHSSTNSEESSFDSIMHRLCSVATTALSVLMVRYPDTVIDAAQDVNTVRDIISISLQSTGLSFFPILPRVHKMWEFAQSRVLEKGPRTYIRNLKNNSITSSSRSTSSVKMNNARNILRTGGINEECSPVGVKSESDKNGLDQVLDLSLVLGLGQSLTGLGEQKDTDNPLTGEVDTTPLVLLPPDMDPLLFDPVSVAVRRAVSEALSCELGLSPLHCLLTLDYFMGDEEATRNYLLKKYKIQSLSDKEFGNLGGEFDEFVTEEESAIDLSDENPLRNTAISDPFYDSKSDATIPPWLSLIPFDIHLDRLSVSTSNSVERTVQGPGVTLMTDDTIQGLEDGIKVRSRSDDEFERVREREKEKKINLDKMTSVIGTKGDNKEILDPSDSTDSRSMIPPSCYLVRGEDEGPSKFPQRDSMYRCMSPGEVRTYTIVSSYDYNLGVATCSQAESSALRIVKKYYDQPVTSMTSFVQDLDMSVTILRLRDIASKLLEEGNLNLHRDAESVEDWLGVLRLVVFSESKKTSEETERAECKYLRLLFSNGALHFLNKD